MKEYRLEFMISVQSDLDLDDFLIQLQQEWPSLEKTAPRTFRMGAKWVEVEKNPLYDPELVSDPTEGYMYYRYRILVEPKSEEDYAFEGSADLTQWINFAKSFKSRLKEIGYLAKIVAEYEQLPDE